MGKINSIIKVIIYSLTLFSFLGCTRPEADSNSKVTLSFPAGSGIGISKATAETVNSSKILDDGSANDWGQTDPAAISEVGCYGVFISGDDNNSRCSVGSGTTYKVISFNQMAGLVAAGSGIEVEVKPGLRTFYVLGMKKGSAACGNLSGGGQIDSSNYSNPIILGQATAQIAGATATVNVNISLNSATLSANKISNCAFMGSNDLSHLVLKGPVSASGATGEFVSANLNENVCGKYYLALSRHQQFDGGGEGGMINESSRSLRINYSAPLAGSHPGWTSSPTFYKTANCSASSEVLDNEVVEIPAGEGAVEVYAKGVGTGWINGNNGARPFTVTDVAGSLPSISGYINIKKFSVGTAKLNTLFRHLTITPGQCREADYYWTDVAPDGNSYYVNLVAGRTIQLKKNDASIVSVLTGVGVSGLGADCSNPGAVSGTGTSYTMSMNNSFGSFGFRVDSAWTGSSPSSKDLLLSTSNVGDDSIYLNTNVLASDFVLSPAIPNAPFASDCIATNVTPKESSGSLLDIFGFDLNGVAKRLPLQAGASWDTGGNQAYLGSTCAGTVFPSDWTAPSVASGSPTQIQVSFRPGYASGPVKFFVDAWPFVNSKSDQENGVTINPQWDPGLIGGGLVKWIRPREISGSSTSWPGIPGLTSYPFSVSSSVATGLTGFVGAPTFVSSPAILGIGVFAVQMSGVTAQNIHTSGLQLTNFSTAMMVNIPSSSSGAKAIASFSDNTPAYKYKLMYDGTSGQVSLNNVNAAITPGWHVLHTKSESCSTNCNLSFAIDGGSYISANTISATPNVDYYALGAQNVGEESFTGLISEAVVINDVVDRRAQINSYLKSKYPNSGLP